MKLPVIMVCVTGQKTCVNLIYGAAMIADELGGAKIKVVHVALENQKLLGYEQEGEALEFLFQLSKEFGADMTVVRSSNVLDALSTYAFDVSAEVILLGSHGLDLPHSLGIQLQNRLPDCEVRILASERKMEFAHSAGMMMGSEIYRRADLY